MKFITSSLFLVALVKGHIEMVEPPPRQSQYNPNVPNENADYNMNAPLDAFQYPCKKYHPSDAVRTYKAGENISVDLDGGEIAKHNGGHCEFSLSYDNGEHFVVIKDVLDNCLRPDTHYDIPIPKSAPASDKVVFAWSWINRTGNREYYMNCADIKIENDAAGVLSGPSPVVANLPACVEKAKAIDGPDSQKCHLDIGCSYIPEFTNEGDCDGSYLFKSRPMLHMGAQGLVRADNYGNHYVRK